MKSSKRLQGLELIDCARANSLESIAIAAERCGYNNDSAKFEQELRIAGEAIGIEIQSLSDLNSSPNDTASFPSQF